MDNEKNWYPKYPSIHVSKENGYPCIHISMYPSIHDIQVSNYPSIQKKWYPRYPNIRISKKSGIRPSLQVKHWILETLVRFSTASYKKIMSVMQTDQETMKLYASNVLEFHEYFDGVNCTSVLFSRI